MLKMLVLVSADLGNTLKYIFLCFFVVRFHGIENVLHYEISLILYPEILTRKLNRHG